MTLKYKFLDFNKQGERCDQERGFVTMGFVSPQENFDPSQHLKGF
jgi:hypothetical protein